MNKGFYLMKRVRQFEQSFGELVVSYLEKRLEAHGKEDADLRDYQECVRRASASLYPDSECELKLDAEAAVAAANDDDLSHWKAPEEIIHELQGVNS